MFYQCELLICLSVLYSCWLYCKEGKAPAISNYRQGILRHYAVEELLQRYSAVIVPVESSHNINQVIIRGVALVLREYFLQALNGEEASTEAV